MSETKNPEASPSPEAQERVVHEVDGIQELDNKLPRWWLYTLYGAIVFAAGYWFTYHVAAFGESPLEAYKGELDRAAALEAANLKVGEATPEALVELSKDPRATALGKQVFTSTCAACHRQDGGGIVGPNLTDEYWLHGGAPEKIYATVARGVPDKGMPAWQPQLGPLRTQAVAAYVIQLRGTNAPGGKPPQGERETLSQR
jgi:cytochrome c oxidase cbb3-type subunit III